MDIIICLELDALSMFIKRFVVVIIFRCIMVIFGCLSHCAFFGLPNNMKLKLFQLLHTQSNELAHISLLMPICR